ncbi:hypothetical protein ACTXMZ_10210 [Brachybacterium alimentarium]|uniref:hypothetical protein n=1 Tax=Brachybacterium alimentarium TaxID=47845 RepID=UPI003FD1F25E
MSDNDQQPEKDTKAEPFEVVPVEVRQRLAAFTFALGITPDKSVRRGGIVGMVTGEQQNTGPSITDALRIARFACDDYRDLAGVDAPDLQQGVTAHELLNHFTRKDA